MTLPHGLEAVRGAAGWGFALPDARGWAAGTLDAGERLRDAAARTPGTLVLHGRGEVWAMPAPAGDGRWVVRPYRRGGAVAGPLLGDLHARLGVVRPVVEARASAAARARGIATPRVVAGAVYPAGPFYRADLVTEYIPAAEDLGARLLSEEDAPARARALREAGHLVRRLAEAGLEHPDMNARNILLAPDGAGGSAAWLLDLDRCRVHAEGRAVDAAAMLARLDRSLAKILGRAGRALSAGERAALWPEEATR